MLKIARLCAEYLLENIMSGCCTIPPREAPAIPLWINGRPMLAMPLRFHEVREAATQRLIRRVPMVDAELAALALNVAQQATGLPLAEVMTAGTARPSAQGQVMIRTAAEMLMA